MYGGGVNLQRFQQYFRFYDFKGCNGAPDGKLDRGELAHAAQDLLLNGRTPEQTQMGEMLATLLQGGNDCRGLFPDFNHDEAVDMHELQQLSARSGGRYGYTIISPEDFQAAFGNRAIGAGGGSIDIRGLQLKAMQNLSELPGYQPMYGGQYFGAGPGYYDNYGQGGMRTQMLQTMSSMLQTFQMILGSWGQNRFM